MQERTQALGCRGRRQARAVGARGRLRRQADPVGIEGVQNIEHGLVVAAQVLGDARRSLAAGAGQHDLRPSDVFETSQTDAMVQAPKALLM